MFYSIKQEIKNVIVKQVFKSMFLCLIAFLIVFDEKIISNNNFTYSLLFLYSSLQTAASQTCRSQHYGLVNFENICSGN